MKLDEIRKRFLEYFRKNSHEIQASSSIIPEGDPTLLFTNAGMNQFKDVFLGVEKRNYSRAVTAQKCFRASGKHNDLENVGRTARHHTFFEMLGNFSFGDYFKKDAIRYAWEFMTEEMGLDKDKLWITVYMDDDEALELWQEVAGVAADRILKMDEKENFWSMGETGPCGPCSEIHYDQGPKVGCGQPECGVACECDRYLELWNLVFMQFNRDQTGKMTPLPKPSIDTGMGLERIAAVMQGVHTNYDTDLFRSIIQKICELTQTVYGEDQAGDVSLRVIADHARAMAFLIADGVIPDNEGRGYVLRRVMRRAGRHAKMLGKNDPVLYKVADVVVDLMGEAYPELIDKRAFIGEVIKNEEERFLETLDSGLKILQKEMNNKTEAQHSTDEKNKRISGQVAFKLYDTYGFPLDLTQTIAAEKDMEVDVQGFEEAMEKQRQRAREHWSGSGEKVVDSVYKKVKSDHGPTEFLGYDTPKISAKVIAIILDKELADKVGEQGRQFQLVTDSTPFYGESGGQLGDTGRITGPGLEVTIEDTKKPIDELIVHHCILENGSLAVGDTVNLEVDEDKRSDTMRNHSATHLLQAALREIIGDHVHQKGSLVAADRLRFDLTHFSAITPQQIREIEARVNEMIRSNNKVDVHSLSRKEAVKKGAMALFGEKYGETVRMVEIGDFSRELCGGTHTHRTGDIGMFKIIAQSSVAAGVRRIEALTGKAAVAALQEMENRLLEAAERLKAGPDELIDRIVKIQDETKNLKKELKTQKQKKSAGADQDILAGVKEIGGIKVLVSEVEVLDMKELRSLGDQVKERIGSGVAVLGARVGKKAHLLAVVSKDLTDKLAAGKIVSEIAPIVGGKGGGRPDFAQAGGQEPQNLKKALARAKEIISEKI